MHSRRRSLVAGIALACGAALLLSACSSGSSTASGSQSTTLTIAARQDVSSFDTGELDTGAQVQYWQPVYDTLLTYTADGEIEPNLATEFEYNDDATVLSLTLREGVEFTDGTPFDADAVKANIEHLQAGSGVSVYMASSIEEVVVVDDTHVELHLSAPDPGLTYYLCLVAGAMASPEAFDEDLATTPVGSGPYVLDADATIRGSQYTYTRNEDYWNADAYPYDTVVVKPMDDITARLNAIKSGQVNSAEVDASVLEEAESSGLTVNQALVTWVGLVIFDREGTMSEPLGDVRVRQALNYAVDGASISENIYGGAGEPSQQIFGSSSPAYTEENDDRYPYDPEKAKELLAEAGYADGFTITMPEISTDLTRPYVTQQLADIGVTVEWEKVAAENVVSDILAGTWAMVSFGSSSGHPWRDIYKMIAPDGAWNPLHTTNAEIEGLLADVTTTQGDEQVAAYQAVNDYVTENAWFAVWLFTPNIQLTDAQTTVAPQAGSGVPYLRNYAPAQ